MKNIQKRFAIIAVFILYLAAGANLHAQTGLATAPQKKVVVPPTADELSKLKSAVESNPTDLAAHQAYIKAVGVDDP
ncbi:MAG: hypothetical protein JWQ30_1678, partial [Sediminibacterium sp.]|nr:hypothetical protein [Sediminibacterium sp.]